MKYVCMSFIIKISPCSPIRVLVATLPCSPLPRFPGLIPFPMIPGVQPSSRDAI